MFRAVSCRTVPKKRSLGFRQTMPCHIEDNRAVPCRVELCRTMSNRVEPCRSHEMLIRAVPCRDALIFQRPRPRPRRNTTSHAKNACFQLRKAPAASLSCKKCILSAQKGACGKPLTQELHIFSSERRLRQASHAKKCIFQHKITMNT